MKYLAFALLPALVITGCSSLTENQKVSLSGQANRAVTCQAGSDCSVKWARALQWVRDNSAYPVQTQTDNLIQTEEPSPVSVKSAYTITRQIAGNGFYLIDFSSGCGAVAGCVPSSLELKAGFVTYVMDGPTNPLQ